MSAEPTLADLIGSAYTDTGHTAQYTPPTDSLVLLLDHLHNDTVARTTQRVSVPNDAGDAWSTSARQLQQFDR